MHASVFSLRQKQGWVAGMLQNVYLTILLLPKAPLSRSANSCTLLATFYVSLFLDESTASAPLTLDAFAHENNC